MLTVLPVSGMGNSITILVLKSFVKRYEDNVVTIIQIGGEKDEKNPYSVASFIVLMLDKFDFTAFVSDRVTQPGRTDYRGGGSFYYEDFCNFVMDFYGEGEVDSSGNRFINQYGIQSQPMGFSWTDVFSSAYLDANYQGQEELKQDFFWGKKGMDWVMNIYRIFLLNSVLPNLYGIIREPK